MARRRHYATPRETVIEALERAFRSGLAVTVYHCSGDSAAVDLTGALRALQAGTVARFTVRLGGQEMPL